ncbi:hypothetical protein Bca4012_064577 [Brassica carinata]|uniref:Uncharacterized protein n=1 Tax=Brassica carinata TaxID=52824 RepID=A0A8X8AWW5_BRACI|nr:hypothetical protein Bca52824_017064 [Brassica carinata]
MRGAIGRRYSNPNNGFRIVKHTSHFSSFSDGGFGAAGRGQFDINREPEKANEPVGDGRGSSRWCKGKRERQETRETFAKSTKEVRTQLAEGHEEICKRALPSTALDALFVAYDHTTLTLKLQVVSGIVTKGEAISLLSIHSL